MKETSTLNITSNADKAAYASGNNVKQPKTSTIIKLRQLARAAFATPANDMPLIVLN